MSTQALQRFDVSQRYSEMAVYNGVAYLGGQIADDASLGFDGQMRQVLGMIDRLLARAGTDKSRILQCQIYLADLADFEAMNAVWDAWVSPGHAPPRATVQAKLANPQIKVELVLTAAVA
jgi:enamine deaminase RidA (YjgF/YER057c/UK114 family)